MDNDSWQEVLLEQRDSVAHWLRQNRRCSRFVVFGLEFRHNPFIINAKIFAGADEPMQEVRWWLVSFMLETWNEFGQLTTPVVGFRKNRLAVAKRIRTGDRLLAYITGISRFVAVLDVTSEVQEAKGHQWGIGDFPIHLRVNPLVQVPPEAGVRVADLRGVLPLFKRLKDQKHWSGPFRASPTLWKTEDATIVEKMIIESSRNPKFEPIKDSEVLQRRRAFDEIYKRN